MDTPSDDPNHWTHLLNLRKPNSFSRELIVCGIYALEKQGLIDDTQELETLLKNPDWKNAIVSNDLTEVKNAVAKASEPFA